MTPHRTTGPSIPPSTSAKVGVSGSAMRRPGQGAELVDGRELAARNALDEGFQLEDARAAVEPPLRTGGRGLAQEPAPPRERRGRQLRADQGPPLARQEQRIPCLLFPLLPLIVTGHVEGAHWGLLLSPGRVSP